MRDEEKEFLLLDREGNDVLGGKLGVNNAYLDIYAKYVGPGHRSLEVNEEVWAHFSLSGTNGQYRVKRIK